MNPDPEELEVDDSFGRYLAERLIVEKSFSSGLPEEAAVLAEHCDFALCQSDFSLSMALIFESDRARASRFTSRDEVVSVARECLKYTGSINGAKMPVIVTIYEVAGGPPSEDDRVRLTALQKSLPGRAKVGVTCLHIDTESKSVWTPAAIGRFHVMGRWVRGLLSQPRKVAESLSVPEAVLPEVVGLPLATIGLLTVLLCMFALQQFAQVGERGNGVLGVNVGSLFALGGMNSDAVLKQGEWYRLLSAALLHGDAVHLVFNGLALGLAAYLLESLVGKAWLLCIFALGALGGSLMGLFINPASIVSVGASGAVMGLLAAAFIAAFRFPRGSDRTHIQMQLAQFLIPSLIPLASHRSENQVDYAAHFGGAIVGALIGIALLKMWPRDEERPRFFVAVQGLSLLSVFAFAASLLAARAHYPAYAEEAAFSASDLLVDDELIPEDVERAKAEVEVWGKDHPRDPRVHYFRALRLVGDGKLQEAEVEFRAALSDQKVLDRAFSNGKFETMVRLSLCTLLLSEGKSAQAKREAEPVCKKDGEVPDRFREYGLCD